MKTLASALALSLLLSGAATIAVAQPTQTGPVGLTLTPVLETATTITGQPIRFPQGDNQFTAVLAEVAPGGQVGRHMHPVPLFVYMLEGTLSIEMDGHGTHTFSAGQGFAEVTNLAQRPQPDRQASALPHRVLRSEGHAQPHPAMNAACARLSTPEIKETSL
jgi:quercetin dioxygenase-like cupin family protein